MTINYREHIPTWKEIREILVADIILILAFDLTIIGGISSLREYYPTFIYFLPITAVGVTLSFVLHELMHKFVAQRFGAMAAFMRSSTGSIITILSALFGFLIGIPGATVIYSNSFTRREQGYVSLAGPLTNFMVFLVFLAIGVLLYPNFLNNVLDTFGNYASLGYIQNMINFTLFISLLLAFFNMLPIPPLDGSKILAWNKPVFVAVILVIFILFVSIMPLFSFISMMAIWLVIAFLFSMFYRTIGL